MGSASNFYPLEGISGFMRPGLVTGAHLFSALIPPASKTISVHSPNVKTTRRVFSFIYLLKDPPLQPQPNRFLSAVPDRPPGAKRGQRPGRRNHALAFDPHFVFGS